MKTFLGWDVPAASLMLYIGLALFIAGVILTIIPYDRTVLHPGYLIFFSWTAFCTSAVFGQRLLTWLLLSLLPLCSLAWLVWSEWRFFVGTSDGYGFYPWGAITLFTGMCLSIAATCMLSLLVANRDFIARR